MSKKEVSILFGELFHEFDIQFAIDGFYQKPETLPPIPLSRILLIIGTQQNPELERLNQMAILELDRPFVMQGLDLIRRKLKTNGSFYSQMVSQMIMIDTKVNMEYKT